MYSSALQSGASATKSLSMLGLIELLKLQNIRYPVEVEQIYESIHPFPPHIFFTWLNFTSFYNPDLLLEDIERLPESFREHEIMPYFLKNICEEIG